MLKIITGIAKGKRIETLEGEATRPTSQRIKEALFSAIQFDVENRRVLDLFAGSGQLGLEALSRGASSVTFVDMARESMDIVKKNARSVGFFERCRYVVSDYRNYVRKASDIDKYDLVFIDPPYNMHCCADAVARISEKGLLQDGAILAIESGDEELSFDNLPCFEVIKSTKYGKKTTLNILIYREGEKE